MTQNGPVELGELVITPWDVKPEYGAGNSFGTPSAATTGAPHQYTLATRMIAAQQEYAKKMDAEFAAKASEAENSVNQEITELSNNISDADPRAKLEGTAVKINVLLDTIRIEKTAQLNTANEFYQSDPFTKTGWDFWRAGLNNGRPNDSGFKEWAVSYAAAHSANLSQLKISALEEKLEEYTQQIESLNRQAEQEAQAAINAARMKTTFSASSAIAATAAAITQIGSSTLGGTEASGIALRTAVKAAVSRLAATAAGATASLSIGPIMLMWPSSLDNGERVLSVSLPLDDLSPPAEVDLSALGASGGSVNLSYKPAAQSHADQLKLFVARTRGVSIPGTVRVYQAQFDATANVYSLALDSPPRILTWTPASAPGSEGNPSTSLPAEQQLTLTYHGPKIAPDQTQVETYPAANALGLEDLIVTFPADSGVPPLYVMFSAAYPGATAIGEYSGRPYNPEKAGGTIEKLDWTTASITREGVDQVKLHTSRFGNSADNNLMIERLDAISEGTLLATDTDKRFYTHEMRELVRYRNLGIADGAEAGREVWNNAHTATLEDFRLADAPSLFYTPEADVALQNQLEELMK
jgi:hypothetical protein